MTDFRVVSAGEVADEIVARLAGTQIPAELGDWVRHEARGGQQWGQHQIGYGTNSCVLAYKLMPDGRIELQLMDCNMSRFWDITLRPVPADG